MSNTTTSAPAATRSGSPLKQRGLVVLAATVVDTVICVIAGPIAGVPLKVKLGNGTQHVQVATVIVVTLLVGVVASLIVGALERRNADKARTRWVILGLVVLVISLSGPLGGQTTATKLSLICIHLATAAVLIPGLARTISRR